MNTVFLSLKNDDRKNLYFHSFKLITLGTVLFIELENRGNHFLIVNRGSLFQFETAEIFNIFFRIENRVNNYVFFNEKHGNLTQFRAKKRMKGFDPIRLFFPNFSTEHLKFSKYFHFRHGQSDIDGT